VLRPSSWAVLAAGIAPILLATLLPDPGSGYALARICSDCSRRLGADIIVNVLLFIPLGAALRYAGLRPLLTVAAGLGLTAGIEVLQHVIPGRYPSIWDVAANVAGAWLGWYLLDVALGFSAVLPRSRALLVAAAAMPAAVLAATGLLLVPSFPPSAQRIVTMYDPAAAPEVRLLPSHPEWRSTRIGFAEQAEGRLFSALLVGERLQFRGLGRPDTAGGPVAGIYDADNRQVLLIGADRGDAVLRYRTRAHALHMDQPELRVEGVLRGLEVQLVEGEVFREGSGWCLRIGDVLTCGLAYTAADGWTIMMYPVGWSPAVRRALGLAWLLVLAAPAGMLGAVSLRRTVFVAATVLVGCGVVAQFLAYVTLQPSNCAALAAGLLTGGVTGRLLSSGRRSAPGRTGPRYAFPLR
jgi:hypothetical protein